MATPTKAGRPAAPAPPTPGSASGRGSPDKQAVAAGNAAVADAPSPAAATTTTAASPPASPSSREEEARVKALYNVMLSVENRLGGGEGVEGLYGSLTRTGMDRVLKSLAAAAGGLGGRDHVVDVGAGLGRPLLHALALGAGAASGVEVDAVKVEKAVAFAEQTARALAGRAGGGWLATGWAATTASVAAAPAARPAPPLAAALPDVQCAPIEALPSLDPATHVYSFWEGIPPAARAALGRLVRASGTVRGVAVVQRAVRGGGPAAMMAGAGFGDLRLRAAFPVSMSGSGRSFQAYVFSRDLPEGAAAAAAAGADCTGPLPRAVGAAAGASPPSAAASRASGPAPPSSAAAGPPTPSSARFARRDRRRAGLPAPGRPPVAAQRSITAYGRVVRVAEPPAYVAGRRPARGAIARPGKVTPHPGALDAAAGAAARAAAPGSPAAGGRAGGATGRARRALAPASPGVAKAASPAPRKAVVAGGRPPLAPRGLGGALAAAGGK